MFLLNKNTLAKPEVVKTPAYEQQLTRFKQTLIDYIALREPQLAHRVAQTLDNEAEVMSKLVEVCTLILQTRIRELNNDALQMFAYWASESNLDAVVSNLGLQRQLLQPAEPQAFPPVEAKYETDEHLRQRYFLAPFSFSSAGPALAYKYHAMTLGERPTITVQSPQAGQVLVSYLFDPHSMASQVKDASAIRSQAGKVTVTILSREGNGECSSALIEQVSHYLKRDDIAPVTDHITVQTATIRPYGIQVVAYINKGPDVSIIRQSILQQLQLYTDSAHFLGASIELSRIHHALHQAGVTKIDLQQPTQAISCESTQAPYCENIDIEIRTL